tara:strand:- start:204 stop:425 length:222 start_codon:yes stop_codon:yes gene_type:complete
MKIYKNNYTDEYGESTGKEYFASKREARKAFREYSSGAYYGNDSQRAVPIEFRLTKKGVIEAMNNHGAHAENG